VYKSALDVRLKYFGGHNLAVALAHEDLAHEDLAHEDLAHEDLAYATYVLEYSSGKFQVSCAIPYDRCFIHIPCWLGTGTYLKVRIYSKFFIVCLFYMITGR